MRVSIATLAGMQPCACAVPESPPPEQLHHHIGPGSIHADVVDGQDARVESLAMVLASFVKRARSDSLLATLGSSTLMVERCAVWCQR